MIPWMDVRSSPPKRFNVVNTKEATDTRFRNTDWWVGALQILMAHHPYRCDTGDGIDSNVRNGTVPVKSPAELVMHPLKRQYMDIGFILFGYDPFQIGGRSDGWIRPS